ncbi:MAG: GuaB3 family IMP dehydrogenase-related protein, partial [Actinomycetales bacterium]
MTDIVIGGAKRARRGYSLDEIAIAPSRRTRDPQEVSTAWSIDAFRFEVPFIAAPMDSVVSPDSAATVAAFGMPAALNVEGLWGRYEDPTPILVEISRLSGAGVTARLQQLYAQRPVDPALVGQRIADLRARGITVVAAISPQRTAELAAPVVAAGADV